MVIDFTRYDLPAHEPQTLQREWSLMNVLNQKGTRPQDKPVAWPVERGESGHHLRPLPGAEEAGIRQGSGRVVNRMLCGSDQYHVGCIVMHHELAVEGRKLYGEFCA